MTPLLLLLLNLLWPGVASTKRPNIILIVTDDQDVELGSLEFMPKLQKHIGARGAKYEHGYATTPMCCPSRSSMLTGLYVHNHNVYTNNENCSSSHWIKNHEDKTFATYLQSSGYTTAYFGKYLNRYSGRHIPSGWSKWMGLVRNSRYYNYTLNHDGRMEHHGDNYDQDYLPDLITNRTIELIDQVKQSSSPFMAVLAYPAPHGPEDSAPQYQDMFLNVTSHHTPSYNHAPNPDKQWILRHTEKMLPIHERFTDLLMAKRLQTLQSVDTGIERVVTALRETGQLDNTFIFFTSDHGYHLGQFGLVKGKSFPYEFDTHVPFFVRGPGVETNVVKQQPVLLIDLAPTFLDIAGLSIPKHMDGKSLIPTFTNQDHQLRDAFLIERGKMSFKRYASVSSTNNEDDIHSSLTKRQKHLNMKMARECKKDKYQAPCLKNQNWVCLRTEGGSFKIKPCSSSLTKRDCQCHQSPKSLFRLMRKARSISSPSLEDLHALGAIVANLDRERRKQESWMSSKSLIKTQIQQLRAQLNELKQIRKYLRMRRPTGLVPNMRPVQQNLFEETLRSMSEKCSCSNRVKRSSEDRRMRRLQRLSKAQRKKTPRKTRSKVAVSRKQDHCMVDIKMNCFSHDNDHWRTAPLWTDGSFCACTNSNNNTYWCVRNINKTANYLYCEYVTGMITYSDLDKDPHQLRNMLYTLSDSEISFMHRQLKELKQFSGQQSEGHLPTRRGEDDRVRRRNRKGRKTKQ